MRARLLMSLFLTLLAGCTSPADPAEAPEGTAAPDTPPEEGSVAAAVATDASDETESFTLDGSLTGAGAYTDLGNPFVGSFDTYQPFEVRENATSLVLELSWTAPAHDLYLDIRDPADANHVVRTATPFVAGSPVVASFEAPAAGEWLVEALANGAASTSYTVAVTVTYAAAPTP